MSWRIVVVSNNAKLDFKMEYLVIRQEEITQIHISEISILLIESTAVSMTSYLLCELVKNKVKVIFCDEKRNPISELSTQYGCHDTTAKLRKQISWNENIKSLVWTEIVAEKIRKQKELLDLLGKEEANLLNKYIEEIEINDLSNREGHAAKVYFNSLFGMEFTRTADIPINAALNYGYSILLSCINREIVINGYLTQLGIYHDNVFNQYNLGSDLMEPFRPLVDKCVYNLNPDKLEQNEKMAIVNILNENVNIEGKRQFVSNAIKLYCKSVFDAIDEKDISLIRFYQNEL
ncbi:MAG: type II CRISPR-associated endonuclease Cas1 [Bacteroidaceae bacterium]|nr:type II CRISPR-associated endonuclease Cas1 [Bacteroidaceae bacterium]MEA5017435.1 type II CRISPR-associated endonuclease Cas1 [Erysipelotrichaceae bacterium]